MPETVPAQIWLLPARGGEPRSLTDLPLGAGRPVWSPDGSTIAFAAPVDLLAAPGESDEDRARRGHDPLVAERLDYQADGVGIRRGVRLHLHVVEVETGKCRQVTSGDWDAGEPAWAPDGKQLAFAAATAPDRDLIFRAPVYRVAADGMSDPRARRVRRLRRPGRLLDAGRRRGSRRCDGPGQGPVRARASPPRPARRR